MKSNTYRFLSALALALTIVLTPASAVLASPDEEASLTQQQYGALSAIPHGLLGRLRGMARIVERRPSEYLDNEDYERDRAIAPSSR